MSIYIPQPLGLESNTAVTSIAMQVLSSNVTIVVGAGVSKAAPTNLPLGSEIAHRLKEGLLYTELAEGIGNLPDDLLSIADYAESKSVEALKLVQKVILDSFEFKTAPTNYAHKFLALLMGEGAVQVITTNWDTCIERSAPLMYADLVACRIPAELHGAGTSMILLKPHGCAEIEDSIRVSSQQVGEPVWWATHQVSAALERNHVVFIGIGSIAPYIKTTIEYIVNRTGEDCRIRVADVQLGPDWRDVIKHPTAESFLKGTAEEILDGLLRALTQRQIADAVSLVANMAQTNPIQGIEIDAALQQAIEFLHRSPTFHIWLWARRGTFPTGSTSIILDPTFIRYLIALALINCVSQLTELVIVGNTVSVKCSDFFVEFAWAKEAMPSDTLYSRKKESIISDKQNHTLPPAMPCIIVTHGSVGPLPTSTMPESLVDTPIIEDIIDGPQTLAAKWIPLDSLISVQSIEELRSLLGVSQ